MCQRWNRTQTRLATASIQRQQSMRQCTDRRARTREPGSDHQRLLSGLGLDRYGKDGWLPTSKVTRLVSLSDFLNYFRLTRVGIIISRRCQDSDTIRIQGHRWRHGEVLGKSFHRRWWGWSSDGMVACVPIPKITICTVLPRCCGYHPSASKTSSSKKQCFPQGPSPCLRVTDHTL